MCGVHNDRKHIHVHVIINSTSLSHDRKFRNFYNSSFHIRRIADHLCVENGLSIVENPKPSKGQNYGEWLGENKRITNRERLEQLIDSILADCKDFDSFIAAMKAADCEVKRRGKNLSIKLPNAERFARLNSLGNDYSEEAIIERIYGKRTVAPKPKVYEPAHAPTAHQPQQTKPNLLIDIQAKIAQGKSEGYERWARIFNLKEAAKTLIFLKENGIDSYNDLVIKSSSASGDFSRLTKKIKDAESRLNAITELQKHIGTYGKTRDIYNQYIKSGRSEKFYEEHRADITLHMAAKKYFDGLGYGKDKKLPTIASLKQEYAALLAEKKKMYSGYHELKQKSRELLIAKGNADKILGITPDTQNRDGERNPKRNGSPEI